MSAPLNGSLAQVRIGGRVYPRVTVQRCRVCKSPNRLEIERLIVESVPPASIVHRLPTEANVSARNIADHFRNGHLPLLDAAVDLLRDGIADRDGAALTAGADAIADHLKLVRAVIGKVAERLTRGDAVPSVRDGLNAVRLLEELDREPEPEFDAKALGWAFSEFLLAVKAETDYDQFQRVMRRIGESPTIRWLREAADQARAGLPVDLTRPPLTELT